MLQNKCLKAHALLPKDTRRVSDAGDAGRFSFVSPIVCPCMGQLVIVNSSCWNCLQTVVVAALMVVMLLGIMGLVGLPLLNKMEAKEHTPAPTPVKEEATKDMKVVPEPPVEEKVVRKEEMKGRALQPSAWMLCKNCGGMPGTDSALTA